MGQCTYSHYEIGQCSKPCTGGPADLCVACASYCVKTCEDPTGGGCIPVSKKLKINFCIINKLN